MEMNTKTYEHASRLPNDGVGKMGGGLRRAMPAIIVSILIAAGLFLSSRVSYLLFHALAEGFSIVVACGVFMLAWNSRHRLENDYLLFLGIAYFYVAALDFVHSITYSGMGILPINSPNTATQFWMASRSLESLSLLVAPVFLTHKLNLGAVFATFAAIAGGILTAVIVGRFPDCFIEGVGLTQFKIAGEFVIVAILVAGVVTLKERRSLLDASVRRLVTASILSTIGSEMAFTLYADPYGLLNLIGHFFKIISFYLIYEAVIVTGLRRPYDLFYRQLKRSRDRFELLSGTTAELLRTDRPQRIVERLCERVMHHLDCHVFFNYLLDEKAGKLHLNAFSGIPDDEARRIEWLDLGVAVCGCAARDGCRIVVERIASTGDERTRLVKSYGIAAYACHPLYSRAGRVIGTLSFGTRDRDTFSEEDLELMLAVADQVGIAIVRMMDQRATEESEERFRTLADFTNDMEYWSDGNGSLLYISPSCERITGYSQKEYLANPELLFDIVHRDHAAAMRRHREEESGKRESYLEYRIVAKSGEIRWIGHKCNPVVAADGSYRGCRASNRDISAHKKSEENLARSRDELAAAYGELESFSYRVSHDLRNPLNSVAVMRSLLESRYAGSLDDRGKRCIAEIGKGVAKMGTIITNLLKLSKISHHQLNLDEIRLDAIAGEILDELRNENPGRRAEVRVKEGMKAYADESLVRIALENLIGNAWKYSSRNERSLIEVGTGNGPGGTFYYVKDNGAGFDMADSRRIFEPFERAHPEKEYGGSGIGLSIVKKIVERHGGEIRVESEKGKGACFYFTLSPAVR